MEDINFLKNRFWSGGFLYNPKTNMVLLHKRDAKTKINPGLWAFFGGLNETEELPQQTFSREVCEELSIEVIEENIRPLCDYFNEELQTYRYVFFIESDLPKSQMQLTEGESFDWIPLEGAFEYNLTEKTKRDLQIFIQLQK